MDDIAFETRNAAALLQLALGDGIQFAGSDARGDGIGQDRQDFGDMRPRHAHLIDLPC